MRGWEILSCDLQRVFEAHLDFCQCLQASINHDIALRNPHTTFLAHLSAAAVPHAVFLDRKSPPCLVLRPRLKEQSGSKDVFPRNANPPAAFAWRILQYTCSI